MIYSKGGRTGVLPVSVLPEEVVQVKPSKKKRARSNKREPRAYKYLLPGATLISTAAALLFWNYISEHYGRGASAQPASGGVLDVILLLAADPVLVLGILGVMILLAFALAWAVRTVKDRLKYGAALLLLMLLTAVAFASIIIVSVAAIVP